MIQRCIKSLDNYAVCTSDRNILNFYPAMIQSSFIYLKRKISLTSCTQKRPQTSVLSPTWLHITSQKPLQCRGKALTACNSAQDSHLKLTLTKRHLFFLCAQAPKRKAGYVSISSMYLTKRGFVSGQIQLLLKQQHRIIIESFIKPASSD